MNIVTENCVYRYTDILLTCLDNVDTKMRIVNTAYERFVLIDTISLYSRLELYHDNKFINYYAFSFAVY